MDISKLKVVELRTELASRGLDQKGNKPVLIARLQEALDLEQNENSELDAPVVEEKGKEEVEIQQKTLSPDDVSAQSVTSFDPETSRIEEDSSQFVSHQEESESKPDESEVKDDSVDQVTDESIEQFGQKNEESRESTENAVDETSVHSEVGYDSNSEPATTVQGHPEGDDDKPPPEFDQNSSSNFKEQESMDGWNQAESDVGNALQHPSIHLEDSNAQDALDAEATLRASEVEKANEEPQDLESEVDTKNANDSEVPTFGSEDTATSKEIKEETGDKADVKVEGDEEVAPRERRRNRWGDAEPTGMDVECSGDTKPSEEKMDEDRTNRKRERSPERRHPSPPRRPENEPYFEEKDVLLSWYDSDLHMVIDKDNYFSATVINTDGFGYVWAGVRATYGFEKGKVYFEVKATEYLDVTGLEDEPNPHVLRVGWSVSTTSLQLGEEPLSYGYGATGKISSDCKFQDYGKPFTRGDVIGCYLDLDSEPKELKFTLNGEDLGVAYSINAEELKGQALFPHILTKNCAFHVNFGEQEPWAASLPGYNYVGLVPIEDRIPGPKRPEKREDCEVLMMVGLPASGKTTWAIQYAEEHKDKKYNILGTNTLIDKMKVMGLPRRRNYSGRWEGLISKCTRCLNTLLEIGAQRRRNYILDQTNVYPTAQRRKMRGFEGFVRRAVVIVPTDEDLKARTAKREAEEGKDVPDSAVLEMKANFVLPEKELFNSIEFVELQEEEAAALVKQYNKEGNDAGYESKFQFGKRPRIDERERGDRGDRQRSYSPRGGGGYGRGGRGGCDRGNRNGNFGDRGYNDRNRGGYRNDRSGSGGGGGGNWRDRHNRPRNDDRGNWGGGRGGGSWRDRGGGNNWGGGNSHGRYGGNRDDRGGRGRDDRQDKDLKRPMNQGNWNQGGGYQQGQQAWQGYGNQWGNWGQGYNPQQQQQQWKGYGQQGWAQQGWGNQNWSNWNQQYYNQAYQQGWGGQQAQTGAGGSTAPPDVSQSAATYNYGQAGANQATGQAAAPWPGYAAGTSFGHVAGSSAPQPGGAAGNAFTPQK